jgi:hypothetical protein
MKENTMSKKLTIAIVSLLMLGTASAAMAQEFDPNLGNRYPAYNEPIATQGALQSAPVRLHFQEPVSQGAGHLPQAFRQQVQAGYPQSPPEGS